MVSLQVLPCSELIFPSKTWFFGIYLNFQRQKSFKNHPTFNLPHFETKSYQIDSIKSWSSTSFQQHQKHIPILPKFQIQFNLIFSEKIFNIQELLCFKSKCHGTKPMHPSSLRAFQRHQEHDLKHLSFMDLITTKQIIFLHR